jgi:NlpC/P60 family/Bacterial SH3 domain
MLRTPSMGARAFIPVALVGAVLLSLAPGAAGTAAAAKPRTEADQIIAIAKQQRGDPWRYGANGPKAFDCSGLVIYAYKKAGDGKAVKNGHIRSARAMYRYYKSKGMTSRSNPKPGDIVIWGGGSHVGIYIGNGKAISTLTSGVRIHGVHAVRARFTAYVHTGMWKKTVDGKTTAKAKAASKGIQRGDVVYTDGKVNLRIGPSASRKVIKVLRDHTRLDVVDRRKDGRGRWWLKVDTGPRTGWLAAWLTD